MNQCLLHIRRLCRSFRCAMRGVALCVGQERNFRVHLCATIYELAFSATVGLPWPSVAVLLLAIGMVLAAELANSAVERLCDRDWNGYSPLVRDAKDMAAGAVLICAGIAVIIGIGILAPALPEFLDLLWEKIWLLALWCLSIPVVLLFIFNRRKLP